MTTQRRLTVIHKSLLPLILTMLIIALSLLGCSDSKQFDDPEFWETATVDDMKSVMDDWRDSGGRFEGDFTPLHYATWNRASPELIEALLHNGANVNARYDNQYSDEDGFTPLHIAALLNSSAAIETLLNGGADIEARDASEATPLHIAALYGSASVA